MAEIPTKWDAKGGDIAEDFKQASDIMLEQTKNIQPRICLIPLWLINDICGKSDKNPLDYYEEICPTVGQAVCTATQTYALQELAWEQFKATNPTKEEMDKAINECFNACNPCPY